MKLFYFQTIRAIFIIALCSSLFSNKSNCKENTFTSQENFLIGCNYWASYSVMHMWQNWKPEIIESDFKKLS